MVPGTGKEQGAKGLEEGLKHLREEVCDRVTCTGFGINGSMWLVISLFLYWVFPLTLQLSSSILYLITPLSSTLYLFVLICLAGTRVVGIRNWALAALRG